MLGDAAAMFAIRLPPLSTARARRRSHIGPGPRSTSAQDRGAASARDSVDARRRCFRGREPCNLERGLRAAHTTITGSPHHYYRPCNLERGLRASARRSSASSAPGGSNIPGARRRIFLATFRSGLSDATLRLDLALGVHRRHAPKSRQKKGSPQTDAGGYKIPARADGERRGPAADLKAPITYQL